MLVDLTVKEFLNKVAGSRPRRRKHRRIEWSRRFGFGGNGCQPHYRQERL